MKVATKTPRKLYGRRKEIQKLLQLFNRVCNGEGILLSLPGQSGIGKTSLVEELRKPVQKENGVFISGKFEQYQQNIPYFAIKQALKQLVQQIQESDEVSRKNLTTRASAELGIQARVLNDFMPEFEILFGKQPELGDISPQEAHHRFFNAIRKFLKSICLPEHPVVIFIDDWQWADLASLELLKNLGIGKELRYLLFIASYRDNEVNKNSLFISSLDALKQKKHNLQEQKVGPISINDVLHIIEDSFTPDVERKDKLSELVFETTSGNPFFIRSLLEYMADTDYLVFSEKKNCWKWVKHKNKQHMIPTDIVELFREKLRAYDENVQKIVSLAACLGSSFGVHHLAIVSHRPPKELEEILSFLTDNDILFRLDSEDLSKGDNDQRFVFRHDRLQQAAYSLIKAERLDSLQLEIGRLLLKEMPSHELDINIYELLNKLNSGFELITDRKEIVDLIRLNIKAAQKAFESTAYGASLDYFHAVRRIIANHSLDDYMWEEHYDIYFQYFIKRSESEFLAGQYALAESCLETAILRAKTIIEKAEAYNSLIVQYTLQARYTEAIESGREALKYLGIHLPEENYSQARDREIKEIYSMLANKDIADLANLPLMKEPAILKATKILITMGPPCYRSHQYLWSVMVPIVVRLSLQYGNIPQAGYSHTAFGGLLIWVNRDFNTARRFGDLASSLMQKQFRDPSHLSVFYLMIGSSSRHWFEPLSAVSQDYSEAYEIGLRSGNLQYAAYAFGHNMYTRFFQGISLPGLMEETERSLAFGKTRHNQWAVDLFEGGLMIFRSLIEKSTTGTSQILDDEKYLEDLGKHHNIQVHCIYNILRVYSLLFLGRLEEGLKLSRKTDALIYTVGTQGLLPWPEHLFTRYLLLTGLYNSQEAEKQNDYLKEADDILQQLSEWAKVCPVNYKHKYLLAKAEMAGLLKDTTAFELYENAIETARDGGFTQWEGMANELSARYWREMGHESFAFNYWKNAYVCYQQWGAGAKLALMRQEYLQEMEKELHLAGFEGHNKEEIQVLKKQMQEKQLQRLDLYAEQLQQVKLNNRVATHAAELANATKRLREEVTIRKGVETALRESKEMFQSLFTNMNEGVALHEFIKENDRIVDYRIVDVNPSFLSILGISKKEEVVGKLATELFETDEAPYLEEYIEVYQNKAPYFFETYYEENKSYYSISAVPWLYEGFATIFSDITTRILSEKRVKKQNEELKKINYEKDKFLSIISHDLRSPLASIKNLVEVFLNKAGQEDTSFAGEYAQIIGDTVSQTLELLSNLVEWSQSRSGRIKYKPEDIRLTKLVNEIISLFKITSLQKEIEVHQEVDPEARVFADREMLHTILRNLTSNALKYSNPGGSIRISSRKTQGSMEISVQDNGTGIEEGDIEKLFLDGKKKSERGTHNERGTGLGLLLCKEFVDRHGGLIWVESEKDKGSVFKFSLPLHKYHQSVQNSPSIYSIHFPGDHAV